MRRRPAALLTAGLLGATLLGAGAGTPRAQAVTERHVDRTITDNRIQESSGLAPSLLHPGVLWTHNDSGNPPRLYAIGQGGHTKATLTVRGEPDLDWEAISSFRGREGGIAPGAALIAVADIGDNNAVHPNVRIAIVREPSDLRSGPVTPIRVLRLRYPGGPRDAETLLSDPRDGRLYIVSKTLFGSTLYAVPRRVWPGGGTGVSRLTTLTEVATMSAGFVTDGAFLPSGRILLRGYGEVYVVDQPSAVHHGRLAVLARAGLPDQDQGESIAVIDNGRRALIGSEGKDEPVLRIEVPVVAGEQPASTLPAPTLPASAGSTPAAARPEAAGTVAPTRPLLGGPDDPAIWIELIGGGAAILLLVLGVVVLWVRNG